LTAKGQHARAALLREFRRAPPELAALGREDLEILERTLEKLAPSPAAKEQAHRRRP
jgi:hypothetical protein